MNAQGPVLRDIHLPPAAWWPPAPGWWLLALFVIAVAACTAWWVWRRTRSGVLRAALREIDAIESAYAVDHDAARLADACSRLLRRVARRIDPVAASRSGVAWRDFLHRHARDAETRAALDSLIDARFRMTPALDAGMLLRALRRWCRNALVAVRRFKSHPPHPNPLPQKFLGERETSAQRSGEGDGLQRARTLE